AGRSVRKTTNSCGMRPRFDTRNVTRPAFAVVWSSCSVRSRSVTPTWLGTTPFPEPPRASTTTSATTAATTTTPAMTQFRRRRGLATGGLGCPVLSEDGPWIVVLMALPVVVGIATTTVSGDGTLRTRETGPAPLGTLVLPRVHGG